MKPLFLVEFKIDSLFLYLSLEKKIFLKNKTNEKLVGEKDRSNKTESKNNNDVRCYESLTTPYAQKNIYS